MDWLDLVRWLHVLGACVLIGTGSGIAFFMAMAHRTARPDFIAQTASVVVLADIVFTASAAIIQPITGVLLARGAGWSLTEGWIVLSLVLYVFIGLFWLPVIYIQVQLRDEAAASARSGRVLSPRYQRLYQVWFACGIPAFGAILVIVWLMLTTPAIQLW
jgi:uncharacterized membrane protein